MSLWGLQEAGSGHVTMHGRDLNAIAGRWGTPLHVVDRPRLQENAETFRSLAREFLGTAASVHYACKCNSVPGVLQDLHRSGLNVEVMSSFELRTALAAGFSADRIIVNGPCKSTQFLKEVLLADVRLIVVDSLAEIDRLDRTARELGCVPRLLLRVNPNIRIRGLNRGSSTGRRTTCAFGLDVLSGEVGIALDMVRARRMRFEGFHAHIGTGIRDPLAYRRLIGVIAQLVRTAAKKGMTVSCIDLGGGFPSPSSREFSSAEMLVYQAIGRLPSPGAPTPPLRIFFEVIAASLHRAFGEDAPPTIMLEPGRSIVSNAQLLLLSVEYIKQRPGTETWVITDGGLGTVTLPTYYEYHEIIPCMYPNRPAGRRVTILGPGCFAGDIVVRNKTMPELSPGDVLAVLDSGAYFTAMESNFGHARPAIVAVDAEGETLWRRRESFDESVGRDESLIHFHEEQS